MDRYLQIRNTTRATAIAGRARVASSLRDRVVGLLATPQLPSGCGLLIQRTSSIHMFFMRFPIDAVFVDQQARVTKVVPDLKPWRVVWWAPGARDCIELPAGTARATETRAGDQLEFTAVAS